MKTKPRRYSKHLEVSLHTLGFISPCVGLIYTIYAAYQHETTWDYLMTMLVLFVSCLLYVLFSRSAMRVSRIRQITTEIDSIWTPYISKPVHNRIHRLTDI